jgi:hypothetical protein
MELRMSLQSVLARIGEIQTSITPAAPAAPATPAPPAGGGNGSQSFANQLQSAVSGSGAPSAAAPPTAQAAPGSYPHLDGDLDADPEILQRLEALAAKRGEKFHVNSGLRTIAEQQALWDNRANNPFPVARPGTSRHQSGRACDVSIGGRPIQSVIGAAELRAAGLNPLAGDAVHVELP